MSSRRVIVIGGGAAGFFAAIACAKLSPDNHVSILEKGSEFLAKVKISGGGRCNVTHACFDVRELSTHYPRGERALLGPLRTFQPKDTVEWFETRGVKLKTENDGRIFPVTDSSRTVIDCLIREAQAARVQLRLNCGVDRIARLPEGGFELTLSEGKTTTCDRLLIATGGCRSTSSGSLITALGHSLEAPVPSLFTFNIETPWLKDLAGISIDRAEASVPGQKLREQGPLLITHWGLSGPAILRLSAWGARDLHKLNYKFPLLVNWLPEHTADAVQQQLSKSRESQPARLVVNAPLQPLPSRLWEALVQAAGITRDTRWASLTKSAQHSLVQQLTRAEFQVTGKSTNKDEFVTCGGVPLNEVNLKTMESKICPGLYFAGEVLDIDGITGGFNFQAAWTTGWIAGNAMGTAKIGA